MNSDTTPEPPRLDDDLPDDYTPTARVATSGPTVYAPFRPVHRPPMALLCAVYDGREDGEVIPIRGSDLTIGRTEGDLLIGHDAMMSSTHAKITVELTAGRYRYYLNDLDSTNGTFVRITGVSLKNGTELLVGGRRYRFDDVVQGTTDAPADSSTGGGTKGWQTVSPHDLMASLVEVNPNGAIGSRFFLQGNELWFGADPAKCKIVVSDDPFLDPRAFRLFRDTRGRWHLDQATSQNGTWLRTQRIGISNAVRFQLGEQRFLLKVL